MDFCLGIPKPVIIRDGHIVRCRTIINAISLNLNRFCPFHLTEVVWQTWGEVQLLIHLGGRDTPREIVQPQSQSIGALYRLRADVSPRKIDPKSYPTHGILKNKIESFSSRFSIFYNSMSSYCDLSQASAPRNPRLVANNHLFVFHSQTSRRVR